MTVAHSRAGARRAFTLIELILVMALLATVLALIAPSLADFFRGRSLDSEARRFLSLTRYAQSRAVTEGIPMLLWIDPDQRAYGLAEEFSYTDRDPKALSYALGEDVKVEIDSRVQSATRLDRTAESAALTGVRNRAPIGQVTPTGRNTTFLRFLPDGTIAEASPQSLWFLESDRAGKPESDRAEIWITQSRSRLNYEIQTNRYAIVRR